MAWDFKGRQKNPVDIEREMAENGIGSLKWDGRWEGKIEEKVWGNITLKIF